jgi:hypothetical protein
MEEMITIPRSEYERMKAENAELRTQVQQLLERITLLKNGYNSKTSSTALSHAIGQSNTISLRNKSNKSSGCQPGQFRNSDGKGVDRFARIRSVVDNYYQKRTECLNNL